MKAALTFSDRKKAEPYADALRAAGVEPVLIAPDSTLTLNGVAGLLVSGGTDLNPARYGCAPYAGNEPYDDARDELESRLLREALDRDLPLLAICRGMQLLNVVEGGTLIQHLDNCEVHRVKDRDPALPVHPITVEPGSKLAAILGERNVLAGIPAALGDEKRAALATPAGMPEWPARMPAWPARMPAPRIYGTTQFVNSRHHQAVDRLGAGLRVTARSVPDGVVEALEVSGKRFAVGVQWHPEDQVRADPEQRKLFAAFERALECPPAR